MESVAQLDHREQMQAAGDGLIVQAPAKINLCLLVAGKRPDGFHEIRSVMAKVTYYDQVILELRSKGTLEFVCKGPEWAPPGRDNLAYRAAESLLDTVGYRPSLKLTLVKHIPAGTGLGSASSDAAAVLIGLNHLLHLGLDTETLRQVAAGLGSDVAFFCGGPLALCEGRGEKITELKQRFEFAAVLAIPDVSVSTKKVYDNYVYEPALYETFNGDLERYLGKNRIDLVARMCANMLAESCYSLVKELAELKNKIESFGMTPCCLSGSGSAMFYLLPDGDLQKAASCSKRIAQQIGCRSIVVGNNRW